MPHGGLNVGKISAENLFLTMKAGKSSLVFSSSSPMIYSVGYSRRRAARDIARFDLRIQHADSRRNHTWPTLLRRNGHLGSCLAPVRPAWQIPRDAADRSECTQHGLYRRWKRFSRLGVP